MENITYLWRGKYESRVLQIEVNNKKLITPTYFPSISSVYIRTQLERLIDSHIKKNYPRLLISAYDLYNTQEREMLISRLKKYKENNFLFVDSGRYESYCLKRKWDYSEYNKMIKGCGGDFYAGFDEIPDPHEKIESTISKINKYTEKSRRISKNDYCFTIAHGNTSSELINVIKDISKNNTEYLSMIAITEKECGDTLHDKIKTIQKIRQIISKKNPTNVLHILGCGDPLSIALFSFAGADSFDSNDWSRFYINPKTLQRMNKCHRELIDCSCKFCKQQKPVDKGLLHNLLFYQKFMEEIQTNIMKDKGIEFLEMYVERKIYSKIIKFF